MTTGKQQPAEPSNASDDLIAELSKLMAQDAHDSRQDASAAKPETSRLTTPGAAQNGPAAPFTVRIPGDDAPAPANAAPPAPRFDFGRAAEAVATLPRTEPSFAAAEPAATAPAAETADADQQGQQPEPAPVEAPAGAQEHDLIADLIATELRGSVPSAPETTATPEPGESGEAPGQAAWALKPVTANPFDHPAPERPVLRPVNLTPVHAPERHENDSFRVPPVFGLGTNGTPSASITPTVPAPEAPAVPVPDSQPGPGETPPASKEGTARDPIDEIENLIGRAVRVELDSGEAPEQPQPEERPAASPALRSLATPVLPPDNAPISGADEAILAAAAATGAQVGWVEHDDDHQTMTVDEPRGERAPRRAGMLRALAGPLVAVVLLLAAGFGLYSVLGLGGSDGPAPVLLADTAPIKSVPEAAETTDPMPQSIVFNEMDGVVPGAEEQLVSRDQANVNEVTAIPPTSVTDEGLANRRVRTVTVRPDGTIVSGGEDSLAGASILPVDRPNVPEVPGAAAPSETLLASAGTDATEPTPAAAPAAPLVPGTEIAAIDASGAAIPGKTAPVPYVRPASVGDAPARGPISASADEPTQLLPQAPAAVAATQTPIVTETQAPAYAQLSSQRSPEVAQQIARDLSARYASLLNGAQLEVSRADLGARGIYYRVRVPAASQAGAAQFCASVRASGGDCVAM